MRKKIFFLKQSGIVQGQSHVEDQITQALLHSQTEFTVFDVLSGIRSFKPHSAGSRQQVLHAYGENIVQELRAFGAEWVLVLGGYAIENLFPGIFHRVKQAGHRIASWHADDPYYFDLQRPLVRFFDRIFTVDRSAIPHWTQMGLSCEYLPFGCSPVNGSESEIDLRPYACDVCFIGAPFAGSQRVKTIDNNAEFLADLDTRIFGSTKVDAWKSNLLNYSILSQNISDIFINPSEASRYYRAARINLNLHKDSFGHCWDRNSKRITATSPNERFFSIAGWGGFQLLDSTRPDLFESFDRDLLATFEGDADFRKKITHFLSNEEERKQKARDLRTIVLARHTYAHRIQVLLNAL